MSHSARRTALIVPAPEADAVAEVVALRLAHDSVASLGVPAHVTILFPFAAPEEVDDDGIRASLGAHAAFEFALVEVRRFPAVTYLAPEPAAPFAALTRTIVARFPEYPPYQGTFDTIVPHLTLGHGELSYRGPLPIVCRAHAVHLIEEEVRGGRWRLRRRFHLEGDPGPVR